MCKYYHCSECDYSAPSYRPTKDKTIWCFEYRCNVNDGFANDCCNFKDKKEAELERELYGVVIASYNGG